MNVDAWNKCISKLVRRDRSQLIILHRKFSGLNPCNLSDKSVQEAYRRNHILAEPSSLEIIYRRKDSQSNIMYQYIYTHYESNCSINFYLPWQHLQEMFSQHSEGLSVTAPFLAWKRGCKEGATKVIDLNSKSIQFTATSSKQIEQQNKRKCFCW